MRELKEILRDIKVLETVNYQEQQVTNVCFDSRQSKQGDVFVAVKGTQVDGHRFISNVIDQGVGIIVCQDLPSELNSEVVYIKVKDSSSTLAQMASAFYGHPSKELKLVGVTGTNGKTTIATLCYRLLKGLGYESGLISTIENRIGNRIVPSTHTTPDPVQLNALLAEMLDAGCDYVFMEVSSHALDQNRITGLTFCGGMFTNITHDHLDYHGTFKNYIQTKKSFFDQLGGNAFCIVNKDDRNGMVMLQNTNAKKYTYALKSNADFKGKVQEKNFDGQNLIFDGHEFHSPLLGAFNVYNLLAVYACGRLLDMDAFECLKVLSTLKAAEGRFEYLTRSDNTIAIVDYAHTPDALENVLSTIKDIMNEDQQLICVCGAGGDRDISKRPEMADIASRLSDRLILTSDNPRTESPDAILDDMEKGVINRKQLLRIVDRKEAIKAAAMLAQPKDIILVAGKGHEKYQEVNGVKHPFDDKEILKGLGFN